MKKSSLVKRLLLFGFGCASTQGAAQMQTQLQADSLSQPFMQVPLADVSIMSRQELLLLGLLVLLVASLIIAALRSNRHKVNKKGGKKRKARPRE
jgi:hypothetical protein